jgi:hypothetical protein
VAFFHSSLLPSFTIEDRILLVLSSVAGGILISYSFLAISRSISDSGSDRARSEVAGYMKMVSYGTILLLVSLSSPVLFIFFPPFGVASWSLVGLAVFVFSIGIYAAAISVSEDARLRAAIRKSVMSEPNFLDDFGTAQMGQNLQRRVLGIVEKERDILEKQTGISPSLTEKEVETYLDEVLQEMKRNKRGT